MGQNICHLAQLLYTSGHFSLFCHLPKLYMCSLPQGHEYYNPQAKPKILLRSCSDELKPRKKWTGIATSHKGNTWLRICNQIRLLLRGINFLKWLSFWGNAYSFPLGPPNSFWKLFRKFVFPSRLRKLQFSWRQCIMGFKNSDGAHLLILMNIITLSRGVTRYKEFLKASSGTTEGKKRLESVFLAQAMLT